MTYEPDERDIEISKFGEITAYFDYEAEIFTICERSRHDVMLTLEEALALADAIKAHFGEDSE